jgi:hypothetical protein
MPTKFQSATGEISASPEGQGAKFPIYFCEGCGYHGAGFGLVRADGRLSYCGWQDGGPVCVGKGKEQDSAPAKAAPPW